MAVSCRNFPPAMKKIRPVAPCTQVYFDESGGVGDSKGVFAVAATMAMPEQAKRLIKDLRKATGLPHEIKGSGLPLSARRIFFDLLGKLSSGVSVAVVCDRKTSLGAWAMGNDQLPEHLLWTELHIEACCRLPIDGCRLLLSPDGGRYQKAILHDVVRPMLHEQIEARTTAAVESVDFVSSHHVTGVQIADLVVNSVYHMYTESRDAPEIRELIVQACDRGVLLVHDVELQGRRPSWLAGQAKAAQTGRLR